MLKWTHANIQSLKSSLYNSYRLWIIWNTSTQLQQLIDWKHSFWLQIIYLRWFRGKTIWSSKKQTKNCPLGKEVNKIQEILRDKVCIDMCWAIVHIQPCGFQTFRTIKSVLWGKGHIPILVTEIQTKVMTVSQAWLLCSCRDWFSTFNSVFCYRRSNK